MIIVTATLDGVTLPLDGYGQQLISGTITQEVGTIPSFSFEIDPTNAGFDLIQSRKTLVKCVNETTGRTEFHGRVLLSEQKMSSSGAISKTVTCEGFLGYLHDSIQPYKEEAVYDSFQEYIEMVLENHNAQVEPDKRIYFSWENVSGLGDTLYKGLQYQSTFDTLKTKLVDVFGGEFAIEETDGKFWLSYAKNRGSAHETPIELGVNMQSSSREVNTLDIVTRIVPLGAKLKVRTTDADGNITETDSEERLTLVGHTLNDGTVMDVPWIDDKSKQEALGIVVGVVDFPDITDQYNLYQRANKWAREENRVKLSHTLTAIDLKELGLALDGIHCGDYYTVRNKLIGLNEILRVSKKTIDIHTPYKSNITLEDKKTTLSKLQNDESERVNVKFQEMETKVEETAKVTGSLSSQVTTIKAEAYKDAQGLVQEATKNVVTTEGLNKTIEDTKTALRTYADEVGMDFTKREISRVEGETAENLSKVLTDLHAYIRYYMTDEGLPTIELGTENSDLICYLTNKRLDFKLNGIPVAYIATDENGVSQLYITNATILQGLNLGAFTFKMRDNNNLSLIKTKEV